MSWPGAWNCWLWNAWATQRLVFICIFNLEEGDEATSMALARITEACIRRSIDIRSCKIVLRFITSPCVLINMCVCASAHWKKMMVIQWDLWDLVCYLLLYYRATISSFWVLLLEFVCQTSSKHRWLRLSLFGCQLKLFDAFRPPCCLAGSCDNFYLHKGS